MKLLNKLNIQYLFFSLLAMAISGVVIYFALGHIINYQLDERLNETLIQVETQLKNKPDAVFYDPFIQVSPTEIRSLITVLSDTVVYNEMEKELEECRKISATISIENKSYRVEIIKSKIESEDLQILLALVTFAVILLLTVTLIYVNRRVAKSVWQPFFSNLAIIENFSVTTQQPLELGSTGISEFDHLNKVVTGLTRQIITDFQNQKQFSEDISHELQTPLAIISSRLENLLGNPALKDFSEILNSIYSSVRRLSKLNKAMILLRKIENNQFAAEEHTNLKIIVTEKLEEFSELISLKKLQLETDIKNNLIVPVPLALSEILISNLLSNSINHNTKGGKISIQIIGNQLSICNSGHEKIAEPEKLFNRFYKVDPSSNSVGLGLAIVKKICDLHRVEIQYHFNDNFHCFKLNILK